MKFAAPDTTSKHNQWHFTQHLLAAISELENCLIATNVIVVTTTNAGVAASITTLQLLVAVSGYPRRPAFCPGFEGPWQGADRYLSREEHHGLNTWIWVQRRQHGYTHFRLEEPLKFSAIVLDLNKGTCIKLFPDLTFNMILDIMTDSVAFISNENRGKGIIFNKGGKCSALTKAASIIKYLSEEGHIIAEGTRQLFSVPRRYFHMYGTLKHWENHQANSWYPNTDSNVYIFSNQRFTAMVGSMPSLQQECKGSLRYSQRSHGISRYPG